MSTSRNNHRRIRTRLAVLTTAAIAAMGLAGASSAGATTCESGNGALDVTLTADATVQTAGGTIAVSGASGQPIGCVGGTPTTTNTDVVRVLDLSDNPATAAKHDGSTRFEVKDPQSFAPGATIETGDGPSEVEFVVNMAGGDKDRLIASAGTGAVDWTAGAFGLNWTDDSDIDLMGGPFDEIVLVGKDLGDRITAAGGRGTGHAPTAARFYLFGSRGDDRLIGSRGADELDPGPGTDTALGSDGDDGLIEDEGNDTFDGGTGSDYVNLIRGTGPATVDLARTDRQDSGRGRELFANVEHVTGTGFDDTLVGNASTNGLNGGGGDDVLHGRGGADVLNGDGGADTVTFAEATGPVSVDLSTQVAHDGPDVDAVQQVENVIGSPFADTIVGSAAANRIVGGAGVDTIRAAGGPDRIEIRDGEGDNAQCGDDPFADVVVADRSGVDQVSPGCESVELAPEPGPGPGPGPDPGPGPEPTPDRSLSFTLSGAKAQRLLRQRSVLVKVRCPLEACSTVLGAKGAVRVARVKAAVAAGATRTVKLRLTKAQLGAVRRALAARRTATVKVTAVAQDAAGNRATRTLRVRARR